MARALDRGARARLAPRSPSSPPAGARPTSAVPSTTPSVSRCSATGPVPRLRDDDLVAAVRRANRIEPEDEPAARRASPGRGPRSGHVRLCGRARPDGPDGAAGRRATGAGRPRPARRRPSRPMRTCGRARCRPSAGSLPRSCCAACLPPSVARATCARRDRAADRADRDRARSGVSAGLPSLPGAAAGHRSRLTTWSCPASSPSSRSRVPRLAGSWSASRTVSTASPRCCSSARSSPGRPSPMPCGRPA